MARGKQRKVAWRGEPPPAVLGLSPEILVGVGLLALLTLIVDFGFGVRSWGAVLLALVEVGVAGCFATDLVLSARRAERLREVLRQRWYEYLLLAATGLGLVAILGLVVTGQAAAAADALRVSSPWRLALGLVRIFIVASLLIRLLRAQMRWLSMGIRPEYLLAGSFAILVLLGWAMLMLPRAGAGGVAPIGALDALFTATSAVCVTGLAVRDTGTAFSGFGQGVIAALFQVGGMGIITFVALLSVASGRGLSVPQMVVLRDIMNARAISQVRRFILGIVLITVSIEVIGIVLLYLSVPVAVEPDPLLRLKWAAFHAVSAFCNAGFSLHANSLEGFVGNWGVCLTVIGLLIVGGLGFPVLLELLSMRLSGVGAYRRWRFFRRRGGAQGPRAFRRMSLQTKISLIVVACLIVVGTVGFWLLESCQPLLVQLPMGQQWLAALFQATSPRTAGFNTLPIGQLQDATQIFVMVLMVIGAGPVSTGGGIKTVAFGVLLLTLRSMVLGRDQVEVFGRTLPRRVVHAAISVFIIYTMVATLVIFGLALTDPHMPLQAQAFEAISALSTVGLSTGITPDLSAGGKLLLIVAMFVGRVGPLTLAMSVFRGGAKGRHYQFPEEDVVVS